MKRRVFLGLAGAALIAAPRIATAQTAPKKILRIVVVANRNHEGDGLTAALINQMKRNPNLSVPYNVVLPRPFPPPNIAVSQKPRCLINVYTAPSDTVPSAIMEIWCIDDLAETKADSGAKVSAMDLITNYTSQKPDGVVAFGTAGYPGDVSIDGCVTIGGTIFIHDASNDADGAHGNWSWPDNMEKLVPSKTPASFFSKVAADQNILKAISLEMIAPQKNPASTLRLLIAPDAVGISSVNIPAPPPGSPPPYCDIDTKAIGLAQAKGAANITSVETTHGVIRSKWPDAPFIYVTAIPNRVCHFPDEASQNYAQEFPSSHNAGIALKYVIPSFVSAIA
jgi:hypothetical protein